MTLPDYVPAATEKPKAATTPHQMWVVCEVCKHPQLPGPQHIDATGYTGPECLNCGECVARG